MNLGFFARGGCSADYSETSTRGAERSTWEYSGVRRRFLWRDSPTLGRRQIDRNHWITIQNHEGNTLNWPALGGNNFDSCYDQHGIIGPRDAAWGTPSRRGCQPGGSRPSRYPFSPPGLTGNAASQSHRHREWR
ncbi:uncharacterized protein [Fopius arisanus]|uniref:Uncharacterized protein n=1 Tax=Fopius arisanus TaxID=64838 RepID=A0A9R1TAE7_9HYME|nr:PREDICTED: uncharacterized protein LOC105268005 [Fopius arisanus]